MADKGVKVTPGVTAPATAVNYSAIQQPAAMSEEGNLSCNWRDWKSAFDYYLVASGKENAPSREKCALFLHIIGKFGREILEELDVDDKIKTCYEDLVTKFAQHCDPARNVNYERHIFFESYQRDDVFDKFLSNLRIKSKSCDFKDLRSSLILTQLIRGLKESVMRERLLAKQKLSLEEAVLWCRAAESAGRQAEACGGSAAQAPARSLEALGRARASRAPWPQRGRSAARGARQAAPQRQSSGDACAYCGRRHGPSARCWARNVKCYKCDSVGHYAKLCRVRQVDEALEDADYGQDDYDETVSGVSWEEWWTYDGISGPAFWGLINPEWSLCNKGRRQSPVNLEPEKLLFDPNLRFIHIDKHRINGLISNTGHSVIFTVENETRHHINITGGPLSYKYQFHEIHIHYGLHDQFGSEHAINGYSFPAEIQIFGFNSQLYSNFSEALHKAQGIVSISLLLQLGDLSNPELRILTEELENIKYGGAEMAVNKLSVRGLLPDTDYYMTYDGSTTAPACFETVTWIIVNKPIYITKQQLHGLRRLMQGDARHPKAPLGNNFRPPQPLHHRAVRTNIDFDLNRPSGKTCPSMHRDMHYKAKSWTQY